jgi:outer membrane immunogenic protein
MNRILFAGALVFVTVTHAIAADLPLPGPAPAAPATYSPYVEPVFSWTGFYLGINGGYAFGTSNWYDSGLGAGTGDFSASGFLIGGTVGANYQWGAIVYGVEADGDWSNLDGTVGAACTFVATCETKGDWLATVRGRMGYAWDRLLVYTTAGAAFGNVQAGLQGGALSSSTRIGWTAGVGVEGAFAPNWTARVEYLFVDFANASCTTACDPLFGTTTTVSLNESIVRAGIDYKFAW